MSRGGNSRRFLRRLYGAALAAVDPAAAVRRALEDRGVRRALAGRRRVGVFAVGKAASGMARAALRALPALTAREALVIVPRGDPTRGLSRATVLRAAHPEPDASSVRAADRALEFFRGFSPEDAIVCLISGGSSSLLEKPRAGLSLAALRGRVRALVRAGAPIGQVNRLRTRLSAVKGGRLGKATRARLVTLVLSDVPGDRASLVGSGPTIRGGRRDVARGNGARTDVVRLVGSNRDGVLAAAREARARGLAVRIAARRLSGDADPSGRALARRALRFGPGTVCIAGGETVVALGRSRERGGRSLELALAAALELEGGSGVALLAAGSDGRDGSSSAAGAFADGATVARGLRLGLDPRRALRRHATHAFFARLGDLQITGPTGTNVGDWVFLLREGRRR
jgi:glycerate-2-kinase